MRYEFEAKWTQDIDGSQGRDRQQSQLDMRYACARNGVVDANHCAVIVIAPSPDRYPPARKPTSVFRRYFESLDDGYCALPAAIKVSATAITWEQVLTVLARHPEEADRAAYLAWRLNLLDG
jgi:hypothetical protein